MKTERIYLWENRKDVYIDTYIPEYDPIMFGRGKSPCMIVCPGGAYLTCSLANEGEPVALEFVHAGYKTVVLHYSVADETSDENCRFPAQLIDLGKAFLTVKEHAEEWGIDVNRISLVGFSAGGNLAGLFAARWHEDILSKALGKDPEEFRPFAAILVYGVLDYIVQSRYEKSKPENPMMARMQQVLLGTTDVTDEQYTEVSPARKVTKNMPPVFLACAANDSLVTPLNSLEMAKALTEEGIPYELHIFRKGEHGFGTGVELCLPKYRTDRKLSSYDWITLSQRWLLKLMEPELDDKDVSDPDIFDGKDCEIPNFFDH